MEFAQTPIFSHTCILVPQPHSLQTGYSQLTTHLEKSSPKSIFQPWQAGRNTITALVSAPVSLDQDGLVCSLSLTAAVQWAARIFAQQLPVHSAGHLLPTTHVPQLRSFLAAQLFYIYYQLLFLSFKLKHFFLVMKCFLCINLLYHHVPPSTLLYRERHPWCQRMQVQQSHTVLGNTIFI